MDQALLWKGSSGREDYAVKISGSEGSAALFRRSRPFDPPLEKCGTNAVADFPARDAFPDGDDLSGAVRQGHRWEGRTWIIDARGKEQIAIIQRCGVEISPRPPEGRSSCGSSCSMRVRFSRPEFGGIDRVS